MESKTMTLGKVQSAPAGLKGFDTNTKLSATKAQEFKASGYDFCIRYVSLNATEPDYDLTSSEAEGILDAGLALVTVQHVMAYGWQPSAALGTTYGTNAANNAESIGMPQDMNLWCDLEGVSTNATAQDVISYCNAWYDAVVAAGYQPGLYVGPQAVLSGQQLYQSLKFQHYWKSAALVPAIPVRGYQMIQSNPNAYVNGIYIDEDTTQNDNEGGQVQWVVSSKAISLGEVQSAPAGAKGFDTNTKLDAAKAQEFKASGYEFCIRYVSLNATEPDYDLTQNEAQGILNAGLSLVVVQHVRSYGWLPTVGEGTTYGTNAANNAESIGMPKGMNLWCDLEGVSSSATAQDVISYCNAWYDAVAGAGYQPGLYVGPQAVLSGQELYQSLKFQHYWKSAALVPAIPVRGYQMIQSNPNAYVNGIYIDEDTTQDDNEGGKVLWVALPAQ